LIALQEEHTPHAMAMFAAMQGCCCHTWLRATCRLRLHEQTTVFWHEGALAFLQTHIAQPNSPHLQQVPHEANANHTIAAAHAALQIIMQEMPIVSFSDGILEQNTQLRCFCPRCARSTSDAAGHALLWCDPQVAVLLGKCTSVLQYIGHNLTRW
jgi:hypothetical protein